MEILAPIAVEQREFPMQTSTFLTWCGNLAAAGTFAFAGAYHGDWELVAVGTIWAGATTLHALSKRPKVQEVTDVHIRGILSPNVLTVQKTAGGGAFKVKIRNTTVDGGAALQETAMHELKKILETGVVEVNQITGNKTNGHEADITVRSIWPGKNNQHTHKDVAYILIGKGLLTVDDVATTSPKYLKALAKAKQEGRGLWGMK